MAKHKIESPLGAQTDHKAGPNVNIAEKRNQGDLSGVNTPKSGTGGTVDQKVISSNRDLLVINAPKKGTGDVSTSGELFPLADDHRLIPDLSK